MVAEDQVWQNKGMKQHGVNEKAIIMAAYMKITNILFIPQTEDAILNGSSLSNNL